MNSLITSALLLASTPELPPETPEAPSSVHIDNPVPVRSEASISEEQKSCPEGQFASAFPDVYPTDWAYEQVNNLANVPIECFDWPDAEISNP